MIALLRKELRGLFPFAILMFAATASDILTRPFTERLDEASWPEIAGYLPPGEGGGMATILYILVIVAAYSAFPREHDEGTIALLYSLPIARWKIFGAKVAAGLIVLGAGLALLQITDGLQGSLSPESYSGGRWTLAISASAFLIQLVFVMVVYGHALLASFLRRFGLLPYAFLLLAFGFLEDLHPAANDLDPSHLLDLQYHGSSIVLPWTPMLAHLLVAGVAYVFAFLLWMGPAESLTFHWSRAKESSTGRIALGCGTAFLGVVLFGLFIAALVPYAEQQLDEPSDAKLIEVGGELKERVTERYQFLYPAHLESRATPLMDSADAIHEGLRAALNADPGAQLLADLTEVSSQHRGIAGWTQVRIALAQEADVESARHALAHETAHAFQYQMTDRRIRENDRAVAFFLEGSAEHLARRLVPEPAAHERGRLAAALAWSRHRIRFEELADRDRLDERLDSNLVYPLGESFADALVEHAGSDAIGDLMRAFSRPDAPQDLPPRPFWEDACRAAGTDLEAVRVRWEQLLQESLDTHAEEVDAMPRVGGGVIGRSERGIHLMLTIDRDLPSGARLRVRVRRGPGVPTSQRLELEAEPRPAEPRRFDAYVPASAVGTGRFQLLFGIHLGAQSWPLYETWQWASLPP